VRTRQVRKWGRTRGMLIAWSVLGGQPDDNMDELAEFQAEQFSGYFWHCNSAALLHLR